MDPCSRSSSVTGAAVLTRPKAAIGVVVPVRFPSKEHCQMACLFGKALNTANWELAAEMVTGNGGRRPGGGYPNHGRRRAFLGRRDRPEPQCCLPQDVPSDTARPSRW